MCAAGDEPELVTVNGFEVGRCLHSTELSGLPQSIRVQVTAFSRCATWRRLRGGAPRNLKV